MKGVALKSCRQDPGEERDWPPPSAPAAVCWGRRGHNKLTNIDNSRYHR